MLQQKKVSPNFNFFRLLYSECVFQGYVKELVDDYVALVVLNDTGAKLKLDQEHLETVIPQVSLLTRSSSRSFLNSHWWRYVTWFQTWLSLAERLY